MKIVVLAGGISPERDVSLSSGALIAGALARRGHQALLLDLCFGADARGFDAAYAAQARNTRSYAVPDSEPDLDALRAAGARRIGKNVVEICADADVVFLALHGDIGENGMLQACSQFTESATQAPATQAALAGDGQDAHKAAAARNRHTDAGLADG